MIRHWYAVYTQPQKERKVAFVLTKRGIENFLPIIKVDSKLNIKKDQFHPLLISYVFVYIEETGVESLKKIPGVANIIYWKKSPAIINDKEIDILKQLTANYTTIKLEKTIVDMNKMASLIGEPVVGYKENSITLKYQSLKINLPSLGYNMIAERCKPTDDFIYQDKKEHQTLLNFFPKSFNALFFN